MNIHLATKSLSALSAAVLLSSVAHAETYITEFTGTDIGSFQVSRIEIVWATPVAMNNPVAVADLTDLSFSFYDDSDALVYTDNAIVGSVVQAIGGVSRTLADLTFNGTSGVSIQSLDNDLNHVQFGAASGETYNLYGVVSGGSPAINLAFYEDGAFQEDATFNVTGQNTTTAVPEPSSCAALAGLFGLGLATLRRKRA